MMDDKLQPEELLNELKVRRQGALDWLRANPPQFSAGPMREEKIRWVADAQACIDALLSAHPDLDDGTDDLANALIDTISQIGWGHVDGCINNYQSCKAAVLQLLVAWSRAKTER